MELKIKRKLILERKNIFPSIPIRNKVLLVPILAKFLKFPGGSFCGAFWEVFWGAFWETFWGTSQELESSAFAFDFNPSEAWNFQPF